MKRHGWCILYTLMLILFTAYVALDTFAIPKVYALVEDAPTDALFAGQPETTPASTATAVLADEAEISDYAYRDENISIAITEYRQYNSAIYVADVVVSDPAYLQTAFAQGAYGKNVTATTSEIARNNGAILAINGDYYGAQEAGFVVRNGTLYRNTAVKGQQDLVIYRDGSFGIVAEESADAEALVADGAQQILSFGPALVVNGEIAVNENEEVGKAMASNPRTAIGIIDETHYLFVVTDGRTAESVGLSLHELAEFMRGLGAEIAYNLDGGGSSTMYFNGSIINNPTTNGRSIKERSVSDIVFIGGE